MGNHFSVSYSLFSGEVKAGSWRAVRWQWREWQCVRQRWSDLSQLWKFQSCSPDRRKVVWFEEHPTVTPSTNRLFRGML